MAQIYLPIKTPSLGRETLLVIPGASHIDQGQLKEILAAETEKIQQEHKLAGPRPKARYSRKEVGGALREFRDQLARKQAGTNRRYY